MTDQQKNDIEIPEEPTQDVDAIEPVVEDTETEDDDYNGVPEDEKMPKDAVVDESDSKK